MKQYNEDTRTFLDDLEEYLNDLKNVHLLEKPLFDQKNDEKISVKVVKIPTQNITFQLFEEGKSIGEIAKERRFGANYFWAFREICRKWTIRNRKNYCQRIYTRF
jgi:hypothetical protein